MFKYFLSLTLAVGLASSATVSRNAMCDGLCTFGAGCNDGHVIFFNPAGQQLSNVMFTLVQIPDPPAWSLIAIGLVLFLTGAIIGRHVQRVRPKTQKAPAEADACIKDGMA
jgi:hypothetical protein